MLSLITSIIMSIIELDKITIKKLTTAQVVTSVFSVVKELVENALDGGANNIDVILEDQGLSFIEVRDNGKGISETDAPFVALSAYTSKLSNFNDLESLETYGFRGEALSALCRVSHVKIITRTEIDDAGRCYIMNHNGTIETKQICARSIGTTVQVSSLLKKIPVRWKIISSKKRANQDVQAIECLLRDFGICHPNIRINYRVDNICRFIKLPAETFKDNLTNIFNRKIILNYEFLHFNDIDVNIELIIPKTDLIDVSLVCQNNYSHIYINNRPVLYKEFEKIIITILSKYYGDKIPSKKKPIFFLIIKVSPSNVDVNLEPNKTKVLLRYVSKIMAIVDKLLIDYYAVAKTDNDTMLPQASSPINESLALVEFMDDIESDDNDDDINKNLPSSKKRKIESDKTESNVNKTKSKDNTKNKENDRDAINKLNNSISEEETLSQMPKLDSDPDFSTQKVADIPILDPECLQNVIDKLEQAMAKPIASNVPEICTKQIQLTESQWSKGHSKELKGCTNVEVFAPSNLPMKTKYEIQDSKTNLTTRGFLKFSENMGRQFQEENPGVDFITIATSIATKWKQLTREEREHYRELGRQDIISDPKLNISIGKKRLLNVTPEDLESNKRRMRNMIKKMGNLNAKNGDDWKIKNVKGDTEHHNRKVRNVRQWDINREQLNENYRNTCCNKENCILIIGRVDDNIWTVNTNSQIWALNLNHLFDALDLDDLKRNEIKGKRELVERYFKRGLNETDNINFMYPIYPK